MRWKLPLFKTLPLLFLLFLSACAGTVVYESLSEKDANEMVVVLQQYNISAKKMRTATSDGVSFSVEVPKDKIQQAQKVLRENNLPKKEHEGLASVCGQKGLIPTPEEEKCRKLLAKKGDIINSLLKIPGIIETDIVLNIPENKEFAEPSEMKKPTASAVIRMKREGTEDLTESRLQQFIATSVENLDPLNVSVIINYVDSPNKTGNGSSPAANNKGAAAPSASTGKEKLVPIAAMLMTEDSAQKFKIYSIISLVLLLSVSAGLILNILKMTKMRQQLKVLKSQGLTPNTPDVPALEDGGSTPQLPSGS